MTTQQASLNRVLSPKTVAVVGMRDGAAFVPYFEPTMESDVEIFFVNPKYDSVMGRPTFPSITAIGRPIDVVYCVTNAGVAVQVVEEAATLDVGGVVLVSSGYGELGADGAALQQRLKDAADSTGMAVIGPNGLGYVNVPRHLSLTIASNHKRRPGGISVVSQSGALLSGVAMAAWERPAVGLNLIISAGNEAVTDLADYVDYLAADPSTTAIGLVIEKIRRPNEFFEAARRAMQAGKPIVALKLARNSRTQAMAASHTGAMTGDAWVYDVAFRQFGIGIARDPGELVDQLAVIEQLDDKFRKPVKNLAIITSTGGYSSLSMDLAVDLGIEVPELDHLRPWVEALIPGVHVPNPLDTTPGGLAHWQDILDRYAGDTEVDTLFYVHPLADEDRSEGSERLVRTYLDTGVRHGKPVLLSNCEGPLGQWAQELVNQSGAAAAGHGPRSSLRGLHTLGEFAKRCELLNIAPEPVATVARPTAPTIQQPEGAMLPFAASMDLLAANGIPVAPYHLIDGTEEVEIPNFNGPYVVKLADVGHRTEHGAVELNVSATTLSEAIARMRAIAERDGLSPTVAIQPMVKARGEAFLGIQNTELGPMIVFGLGGVFVEVLKRIGGRMAPITRDEAESLIGEFEDAKVMHGFRGQAAWDLDALADILVRAGRFAAGSVEWLDSLDINPLIVTDEGFHAVDALCVVR